MIDVWKDSTSFYVSIIVYIVLYAINAIYYN